MTTQKRLMSRTQLFVYGTLRHDCPEHHEFCRGVTGWHRAWVQGRLWRIPEGYLLLQVPPASVLLVATNDTLADEKRRAELRAPDTETSEWPWIEGELLDFRNAAEAWPSIDEWECFVPGKKNVYPRCVVPVEVSDGDSRSSRLVWAYAATGVPPGSTPTSVRTGL